MDSPERNCEHSSQKYVNSRYLTSHFTYTYISINLQQNIYNFTRLFRYLFLGAFFLPPTFFVVFLPPATTSHQRRCVFLCDWYSTESDITIWKQRNYQLFPLFCVGVFSRAEKKRREFYQAHFTFIEKGTARNLTR